jgi:hypothetical protein
VIKSLARFAGWNRHGSGLWLPGMPFGGMGPACCCETPPVPCDYCSPSIGVQYVTFQQSYLYFGETVVTNATYTLTQEDGSPCNYIISLLGGKYMIRSQTSVSPYLSLFRNASPFNSITWSWVSGGYVGTNCPATDWTGINYAADTGWAASSAPIIAPFSSIHVFA